MPRIVLAGRFKGSTYTEVLASHRPYCLWVLESTELPPGLQAFKRWLISRFGGIMAVGKYKLKTYREIVDEDAPYAVWASELSNPTDAMRKFQSYLIDQGIEADDTPQRPAKRQRPSATEEPAVQQAGPAPLECKICFCNGINAVFAGCGHLVCCLVCAYRVDRCPICRVQVLPNEIIRTFTA